MENAGIKEEKMFLKSYMFDLLVFSFFEDFIYLFLEGGEVREEERERATSMQEKNINWLTLVLTPTGDQTCNPDMCPDWELNR